MTGVPLGRLKLSHVGLGSFRCSLFICSFCSVIMSVANFINRLLYVHVLLYCQVVLTLEYAGITLNSACQFNLSENGHNRLFDLSSLSKQRVWQAQVNSSVYVLVTVCGHFDSADKCPDKQASVCLARQAQDNWEPLIPNAGRTLLVNSSSGKHDFSINIVGGQLCRDSKNYSTTIFFTCNPAEELMYVSSSHDGCSLILYWSTSAACISNQDVKDRCTLVLHNGIDRFDIRSLHRPENYVVQSADGRKFELNFCLAGTSGLCVNHSVAACELTNSSQQVIGVFSNHMLEFSSENGLAIIYNAEHNNVNHPKRTEISLMCNYTAKTGAPVFLGEVDNVYKFEMETWTACVQWPMECHMHDKEGNRYDLKGLSKPTGNWVVKSETPGKKYFINVCAAVNLDSSYMMKGVGIAMCSTNSTKSCFSLGTLSTGPTKVKQDPLKLHYTGGSACPNGPSRYKTDISFACARVEKGPVFVLKTNDCAYSFLWETPSACPIKYSVGNQCVVTEPTFNTVFDLKPMYNKQQDYSVQLENEGSFTLNMCGPLRKPCGGFKNASVCLKMAGKEIPIGWTSYEPVYTDGRVAFELHGPECKPARQRTVHIILQCNHNAGTMPTPVEYLSNDEMCTFFFVWHSREACFPSNQVPCMATDEEGMVYDLSPLSLMSSNHVSRYRDAAGHMLKFTINVCRSVVVGYSTVCRYQAAVCMENVSLPDSRNNLVNIGEVTQSPKFENGNLTIRYESGSLCKDLNGPSDISSSIVFICDPSAVETSPDLEKIENCHYRFSWRTNLACPQRKPRESNPGDGQGGNCSAVNPASKTRYDLSPLKKRTYMFKNQRGTVFKVSVCDELPPDVCGTEAGACQIDGSRKSVLGKSNSNLLYDTVLSLNYTGGDVCLNGTSRRNTWLQFLCGPENSASGPSFVEELNDCTSVVAWNTELACEPRKVPCEVIVGDRLVSLAPLIGFTSNYKVALQNYVFFINVCRPTVPVEGLSCVANSAACVATRHSDGRLSDELSLGVPYLSPLAEDGSIVLKYLKGSPCPNSPGMNISTALYFTCDVNAGKGSPVFGNLTDDCQYQFHWKTSIVCPPQNKTYSVNTNCSFLIEEKNVNISLQRFADHGAIVKANNGDIFHVNLCLLKSSCDGVAVCRQEGSHNISYGQTPVFNHTKELTKLRFTDGSVCSAGRKYSSEIHLGCDPHEQIGRPVVLSEDDCSVTFTWKNSIMCFDDDSQVMHSSGASSATAVGPAISGVISIIAVVAGFLYFRKPVNRTRFMNRLTSLFTTQRSHGCVQYSKGDQDVLTDEL